MDSRSRFASQVEEAYDSGNSTRLTVIADNIFSNPTSSTDGDLVAGCLAMVGINVLMGNAQRAMTWQRLLTNFHDESALREISASHGELGVKAARAIRLRG
ncbi:MAG TPA: hypothetical protein PLZ31_11655 [Myxococcota bacterium]|nr:hypothetical protein [Myxococcota bacterium]